jgi:hypothetical protein
LKPRPRRVCRACSAADPAAETETRLRDESTQLVLFFRVRSHRAREHDLETRLREVAFVVSH